MNLSGTVSRTGARLSACAVLLILVSAFLLRLGGAVVWDRYVRTHSGTPFFFGDSDSYWQLGRAIADGTPYEHDPVRHWKIFRMPGYPALLAPLFRVWREPPVMAARMENVLLGVLTVFLTGLAARALFRNRAVTVLAMAGAAVSPELIFQSVGVLSEELFCVLNLALTLALIRLARRGFRSADAALTGALAAAAVYTRPDWYYWLPFAACAILVSSRRARQTAPTRTVLRAALVAAVLFAGLLAPWWIRNARLAGCFVPTTLQMGASLYDGLSPTAGGGSDMSFVDRFRAETEADPSPGFFEVKLDRRLKTAALNWAKSHPAETVRLACVKFFRLWNVFPNESAFSSLPAKLVILTTFLPVLLLAVLGAVRLRRSLLARLLWLPALYVTLLHVIFVASLRYRAPVLPGLIILAAYGLVTLVKKPAA